MRRLALGLPTALQINESYAVLFHESGVSELTMLVDDFEYVSLGCPSGRIWALIDSNLNLPGPAGIFKRTSPAFFVVIAVSPRSKGLGWLKKMACDRFYMKSWTDSEVLQAYANLVFRGSRRSRLLQPPVPRSKPHRKSTLVPTQGIWRASKGLGSICRESNCL